MAGQETWPTSRQLAAFHSGAMTEAHQIFGARVQSGETVFTVWVPDAIRVIVLTEDPQGRRTERHELAPHPEDPGIWQVRIPENLTDYRYEYELETAAGQILRKADPYARAAEMRPGTRSVVANSAPCTWPAEALAWKEQLAAGHFEKPMAIYELHAGTWKRGKDGRFLTYRELADELLPYVKDCGFTHIELLPVTEHPLDESWGYQATGFFAPTSRYGTSADLKYLIGKCAEAGIGIFLDWIPGHFCSDRHALAEFNGMPLYEESRKDRRHNPDWGTLNFDLRKGEVVSFLLSSAHYWLEEFKFDGLRMDALVCQLFVPNSDPRVYNEEGAAFLRKLTGSLRQRFPNAVLIAEDAWNYPGVTKGAEEGGIGFHYKWNFGWMHDMLAYMETLPAERPAAHGKMNFSMMYQYDERFILAFSHDEVAEGKKSMLGKLPGTMEEKFRQLRLLLGYWITHPGKKLLFMGQEFGQLDEWEFQPELEWEIREKSPHRELSGFTKELLKFYRSEPALFEQDDRPEGFLWLDADNHEQSVASFIRRGKRREDECIVLCNFSDRHYPRFRAGAPQPGAYRQVFSTEDARFGGTAAPQPDPVQTADVPMDGQAQSIETDLPAFCMTVWKLIPKGSEER